MKFFPSVVLLGVVLAVLFFTLLFANTNPPLKATQNIVAETPTISAFAIEGILDSAKKQLSEKDNATLSTYLKNSTSNYSFFDSVITFWDSKKNPVLASYFTEQLAEKQNTSESFTRAGTRYYRAIGFAKEEQRPGLYAQAIRALEKALKLDSVNLQAKTGLGVCYVESQGGQPMKGIALLKEVIAQDSNYIDAYINLGLFAIKSGQYDKAIERFNRVVKINPDYLEAYLYLADCYEQVGNKKEAIFALEKYKNAVNDITVQNEIENYINKLKNS